MDTEPRIGDRVTRSLEIGGPTLRRGRIINLYWSIWSSTSGQVQLAFVLWDGTSNAEGGYIVGVDLQREEDR